MVNKFKVGDILMVNKSRKDDFDWKVSYIRILKIKKYYYYWEYFDFENRYWINKGNNSDIKTIEESFIPATKAAMVLYGRKEV